MANFVNQSKNGSIFTNIFKNSATFTNAYKRIKAFLLQEDSYKLLLEDGGGILIDRGVEFTNQTKN
jgi:hypothetical protein